MNMKILMMLLMALPLVSVHASNLPEQDDREITEVPSRSNRSNNSTSEGSKCSTKLGEADLAFAVVPAVPSSPQASQQLKLKPDAGNIARCRALEYAAKAAGNTLESGSGGQVSTVDKRATCYQKAGYTLDYKSCSSTKEIYNYIIGLEKLMMTSQNARLQKKQESIAQTATTQTMSGDGQNAALDASVQDNNYKSSLSMEQAQAYAAAVAMLGAKIMGWQSDSASALQKLCAASVKNTRGADNIDKPSMQCEKALPSVKGDPNVFANKEAKGVFIMAAAEFAAKSAAAMIAAKKFSAVAKTVEGAKDATDPTNTLLEKCITNPTLAECITTTTTATPGQTFSSGDFSIGEGLGTNNLGGENTGTDFGETGEESTIGGNTVAGVDDPFVDAKPGCTNNPNSTEAEKASCILNPAGAASATPTGGSGGGGGGAGGGLGGGGASLGNDLSGDKGEAKASDIKSNKAAGAYTAGGGQGFRGVASSKDDANPFASMFDSKSGGGIEEDASISAATGQDSGLFQKISKRYSQIQAEKRVEASNLE